MSKRNPSKPEPDAFRVILADNGNTVTTIRYNVDQKARRLPDGAGGYTYNRAGAQSAAYVQLDRWQRSQQFIGRALRVVEIAV